MPTICNHLFSLTFSFALLVSVSACSHPKIQTRSDAVRISPRLAAESVFMSDGYELPLKTWQSVDDPVAVVFSLHGFNDYRNAVDTAASIFVEHAITTYAVDQRGFGETAQRGVWAGHIRMQNDLLATVNLLCEKHNNLPVYVLGESMGGAVILSAVQRLEQTCVRGVILSAPAVWGWRTMPWWQAMPLRLLAHTIPEHIMTGEGFEIHPSDNDKMLRALSRDPLMIKGSRVDSMYGLTELMDIALINSSALKLPALILYGEKDDIIKSGSFCEMLGKLPDRAESHWRLVLYPDGHHMLSRDLQGELVIRDMVTWIHDQHARLPSGQEVNQDLSRLSALSGCEKLKMNIQSP